MTAPGSRMSRRAQAQARRARLRKQLIVVGAAAVIALVVLVVVLAGGGSTKAPKVAVPQRTQRTVLLQVTGADGSAVASALLAHDRASTTGAVVLLPPQVLVTVPGGGSSTLGSVLTKGSAERSRAAVEDLMGVTIDAGWVLDTPSFRRLVDAEGGVQVSVDVPVLQGRTVVLPAGGARLTGTQALQFATYLAVDEQEQTRLARLQAVFDAVVNALPRDLAPLLSSLGGGAVVTGAKDVLPGVLTGLQKDNSDSDLQYRSLPVIKVDAGNDDVRFRLDADASTQLVDELLAQSVPPGVRADGNRVLVLNGVGTPGLGEQVRAKLVPAGFVYVGSRNAESFNQCCTQVLVKDATAEGGALGAKVAKALGVPASSVRSSDQIGTIADVVVIVGKDFAPGK